MGSPVLRRREIRLGNVRHPMKPLGSPLVQNPLLIATLPYVPAIQPAGEIRRDERSGARSHPGRRDDMLLSGCTDAHYAALRSRITSRGHVTSAGHLPALAPHVCRSACTLPLSGNTGAAREGQKRGGAVHVRGRRPDMAGGAGWHCMACPGRARPWQAAARRLCAAGPRGLEFQRLADEPPGPIARRWPRSAVG